MDQCIQAGNVSATVDENGVISFTNYNRYRVTVNYTVTAFSDNGVRIKVGGGTLSIDPSCGQGVQEQRRVAQGYSGYAIEISVYKCE